jgi:hypothetical protein
MRMQRQAKARNRFLQRLDETAPTHDYPQQ